MSTENTSLVQRVKCCAVNATRMAKDAIRGSAGDYHFTAVTGAAAIGFLEGLTLDGKQIRDLATATREAWLFDEQVDSLACVSFSPPPILTDADTTTSNQRWELMMARAGAARILSANDCEKSHERVMAWHETEAAAQLTNAILSAGYPLNTVRELCLADGLDAEADSKISRRAGELVSATSLADYTESYRVTPIEKFVEAWLDLAGINVSPTTIRQLEAMVLVEQRIDDLGTERLDRACGRITPVTEARHPLVESLRYFQEMSERIILLGVDKQNGACSGYAQRLGRLALTSGAALMAFAQIPVMQRFAKS